MMEKTFQYVDYLWDEKKATSLGEDEVALFLYRSNILGADLRIFPEDIANGVFAFVGILDKCTGNTLNVDGGMANAFVR